LAAATAKVGARAVFMAADAASIFTQVCERIAWVLAARVARGGITAADAASVFSQACEMITWAAAANTESL
jgi:hypothetical protein